MPDNHLSILSISYDEPLLRTRQWILETAGFQVTSAFGFTQATKYCQADGFHLVIMGHSIPFQDKEALLNLMQKDHRPPVLALRRIGDLAPPGVDDSIDAFEGPEALLSAVRKLLKTKVASAST
jgi:DNA-binding NtrC family response regulator